MAGSPTEIAGIGAGIGGALRTAARRTGADFQYLYRAAVRESGLNPNARAATSSAAGLFQFIEQTWLGAVKAHGAKHGLGAAAAAITREADGRYAVADAKKRATILDLRLDAGKAASLAGELARDNQQTLERKLGRPVSPHEIYAAHFLGASGAVRLLSAPDGASAAPLFGAAADANRNVFFDGARARTVSEIVAAFREEFDAAAGEARDGLKSDAAGSPVGALMSGAKAREAAVSPAADETRQYGAPGSDPRDSRAALALTILQALDPTRIGARERSRHG